MQQFECGLCGRRFMSDAEGPACPSCGVAAAHPVVAAPTPTLAAEPAVEMASAAVGMDAITTGASGATEEPAAVSESAEAHYAEAETQAATEPSVSDAEPASPALADTTPADVSIGRPLSSFQAPEDAPTQAATPIEPVEPAAENRPEDAPTLPAETFAAMAAAPEPAPASVPPVDLAATQQAAPIPAPMEPTPPAAAQPVVAPTPPEQQPVYTPIPERPAMPAGYPVSPAPAPVPAPPNPYQPALAPGVSYGYPPQPVPQPPAGYPPAQPAAPSSPYGYPPQPSQPLQPGMTMPMAAPQFYGAAGGLPTYPGGMTPPQPPQKRGSGKTVGIIAGVVAVALVLGFVGVLAMKGGPLGGSAKPTPTATPNASQILAKMQAFSYTDAAFTMSLNFTDAGQSITGTGSGKITKNPSRSDIQFSFPLTEQGTTYTIQFEVITDGDTSYTQISGIPGLSSDGKWIQSSSSSSNGLTPFDPGQLTNFASLSNATLVGADTVNGAPVYHLTAQDTSSSGGTADIYVRQDNYQPVKMSFTETGATSGSISITFTSFNTGITISTPSPDQVTQG